MIEHGSSDALGWFYAAQALDVLAAVLCALVVWRIHRRQRDQHDDLERRANGPVPMAGLR